MNAKIFLLGAVVACVTQHAYSNEYDESATVSPLMVQPASFPVFAPLENDVSLTPVRRQSTQPDLGMGEPPHTDNANPVQSDFLKGLNDRVREATKSFPSAAQEQAEEITKTMNAAFLLGDIKNLNEQKEALLVLIRRYFAWEQVYLLVDGAKKMADLNRIITSLPSSNPREVEQSLRSQVAEMVNPFFSSHQNEVQSLVLSIVSVSPGVNSLGFMQDLEKLDALHRLFLNYSVQRSNFNGWGEKLGTVPLSADMIHPVAADMK